MKQHIILSVFAITSMTVTAQETYENANIATEDLNGTARYVGMGGAMEALGADLSTIGTNPAGIGLFRSSQARVSFGVISQEGVEDFAGKNKTNMSVDQLGFVYSTRSGSGSFVNFAFNYRKSRNFNQILSAASGLNGASQNKLSFGKGAAGIFGVTATNDSYVYSDNYSFTQLDELYYNTLTTSSITQGATPEDGNIPNCDYNDANGYWYNSYAKGYIGEYDFNLSGNINDRVYLGLTVGIHGVHYTGYSEYEESLIDINDQHVGNVKVTDERRISGTGYNVKAGIIVRPMEYSPFRIGLSVATPTWYDLTSENFTTIDHNTGYGLSRQGQINNAYDFKLYTPWKFGLSLGTTIDDYLALGASFEYADYGGLDPRIKEGEEYDWYTDSYHETSSSDSEMKRHTEKTLKGVSTLKIGAEFKPDRDLAIRFGYNYVSPMYQSDDQKACDNFSPAMYYSSTTAFTNWKATNRITCGIGYTVERFTIDAAYQYSVQEGDFYPFNSVGEITYNTGIQDPQTGNDSYETISNVCKPVNVSNKRHQVLLTLGYSF